MGEGLERNAINNFSVVDAEVVKTLKETLEKMDSDIKFFQGLLDTGNPRFESRLLELIDERNEFVIEYKTFFNQMGLELREI